MNRHQLFVAASVLIATSALASCAGGIKPPSAATQATIADDIKTACSVMDVLYFSFDVLNQAKPTLLNASQKKWRASLPVISQPLCANPASLVDPTKALATLKTLQDAVHDFMAAVSATPAP